MWDYFAFPLWLDGGPLGWQYSTHNLPLSPELRAELAAWSDDRTDQMAGCDEPGWSPPSNDEEAAWDRRGRRLAERLAEELGPAFEVGYFNESTGEVEWPAR